MDPKFFRKYIDIINEAGAVQPQVPASNNQPQTTTLNQGPMPMAMAMPTTAQQNNQTAQKSNIRPVFMPVVTPTTAKTTTPPAAPVATPTQPAPGTTSQQSMAPSTTPPPAQQGFKPSTGSVAAAEPKTVAMQSTSETAEPVGKQPTPQKKTTR